MTDLVRINTEALVGLPVTLADGSPYIVPAVAITSATGAASGDFAAAIGDPDDAAWDGVAASATVISLLKAIALNTSP